MIFRAASSGITSAVHHSRKKTRINKTTNQSPSPKIGQSHLFNQSFFYVTLLLLQDLSFLLLSSVMDEVSPEESLSFSGLDSVA